MPDTQDLADGGARETQIDDVYHVFRGPPDYIFASLPYQRSDVFYGKTYGVRVNSFRMTSVYDPMIPTNNVGNIGVGVRQGAYPDGTAYGLTTAETGGINVQYFKYYAAQYRYYSVLSCRWTCEIENIGTNEFYCGYLYHNATLPNYVNAALDDMMLS